MSKATSDTLGSLHAKVAEKILKMLDNPDKEAQGLVLAIKFLKDNNIQADVEFNETMAQLERRIDAVKLPFPTKVS